MLESQSRWQDGVSCLRIITVSMAPHLCFLFGSKEATRQDYTGTVVGTLLREWYNIVH
jgi:hypothetical protein